MRPLLVLSVLLLVSGCVVDRHDRRPYYGGPPARVYVVEPDRRGPPPHAGWRGEGHWRNSDNRGHSR